MKRVSVWLLLFLYLGVGCGTPMKADSDEESHATNAPQGDQEVIASLAIGGVT